MEEQFIPGAGLFVISLKTAAIIMIQNHKVCYIKKRGLVGLSSHGYMHEIHKQLEVAPLVLLLQCCTDLRCNLRNQNPNCTICI